MSKDYLIVSKKILPEYLEQVITARNLLETHEAASITEAARMAGISRNTYYKYKDSVFAAENSRSSRNAVISMVLKDEKKALSSVINCLSDHNTSILTISQSIPIAGKANVLVSLDISAMTCTIDELAANLKKLTAVRKVHLDAVE